MWTFWKTQYCKDINCWLERNSETPIVDFSPLELDTLTLVEQEQHRRTCFTRYQDLL